MRRRVTGRRSISSADCDTISRDARLGAAIGAHPFLDQRPRQHPHIDRRVELAPDAFDQHHGLLQQQQLRLRLHLELLGHLEQLREQAAERDLGQRPAENRLADGAAAWANLSSDWLRGT